MTDPYCAITGTFADAKAIKTRSTFQIVVELPIESADDALAKLGGWPQPGNEKPVAVMLLNPNAKLELHLEAPDRSLAKQAGILCNDPRFWAFLEIPHSSFGAPYNAVNAAVLVRAICGVKSRADLDTDELAGEKWLALVASYQQGNKP